MKRNEILREITPLTNENCFIIMNRVKKEFNYPSHIHPEFEINFIENGAGAQRVVGDSIEEIEHYDLCLIANPNLEHTWLTHNCTSQNIKEITIQFHPELFDNSLLSRTQFKPIKKMFDEAKKGLSFSKSTIEMIKPKLEDLSQKKGFYSVVELLTILYEMALSTNIKVLSSNVFACNEENSDSRRINKVTDYINKNYDQDIKLSDAASLINMSEVAFCRFFKKRTSKSFIEYLNNVRTSVATKLLADTAKPISEICYQCGFNNISNFNRCFKKKKGCTPTEFRDYFIKTRQII